MVHLEKGRGNGGVSGKGAEVGGRLEAGSRQLTAEAKDGHIGLREEKRHDAPAAARRRGHDESCPYKRGRRLVGEKTGRMRRDVKRT